MRNTVCARHTGGLAGRYRPWSRLAKSAFTRARPSLRCNASKLEGENDGCRGRDARYLYEVSTAAHAKLGFVLLDYLEDVVSHVIVEMEHRQVRLEAGEKRRALMNVQGARRAVARRRLSQMPFDYLRRRVQPRAQSPASSSAADAGSGMGSGTLVMKLACVKFSPWNRSAEPTWVQSPIATPAAS
jgi:hypothetical protein